MRILKKHGVVNTFLREHPRLYDLSRKIKDSFGRDLRKSDRIFQGLTDHFKGKVRFIQIGANDGLRSDPLRDFIVRNPWEGILVEPIPYSFKRLVRNYSYLNRPGLHFENAAIGSSDTPLSFWSFKESYLTSLKTQEAGDRLRRKSSFDKEHVKKFVPEIKSSEAILEKIDIPVVSIKELIKKHQTNSTIHLLAVDAEGYDQEIIKDTLESGIEPCVIFFESDHIPDRDKFMDWLQESDYLLKDIDRDTFAVKPDYNHLINGL